MKVSKVENDLMAFDFARLLASKSRRHVLKMWNNLGEALSRGDFFAAEKTLEPILPPDWDSYSLEKAGRGFQVALEVMKMRLELNK